MTAILEEVGSYEKLAQVMQDENAFIAERMETCFKLKHKGGEKALEALATGLTSTSTLLKHEICYVMGQMRDTNAITILEKVLRDATEAPIVRHEAGEALAAIGDFSVIPLLEEYAQDEVKEVADTCRLGADGLIWQKENGAFGVSGANSVDPAPAEETTNVEILQQKLTDTSLPLFKRYRAMFALRDINTEDSVAALCAGFDDKSSLFKHEVCFVLGQMMNFAAIEPLANILKDETEHEMVRHEAAEALGNIATEECLKILEPFKKDKDRCVAESIEVAFNIAHFWEAGEKAETETTTVLETN